MKVTLEPLSTTVSGLAATLLTRTTVSGLWCGDIAPPPPRSDDMSQGCSGQRSRCPDAHVQDHDGLLAKSDRGDATGYVGAAITITPSGRVRR